MIDINPNDILFQSQIYAVYKRGKGAWKVYSWPGEKASAYRNTAKSRRELIEEVVSEKNVKPENVRIVKIKSITAEVV